MYVQFDRQVDRSIYRFWIRKKAGYNRLQVMEEKEYIQISR